MKIAARFEKLPAYTPIEPLEVLSARLGIPVGQIVKLDANENPYGPSPLARKALAELPFPHIYPDPESRALREALAEFTGAPVDLLLAGAGADELIDLLLRVLLEPGDCVVNCPPSFGMYPFDTLLNAGRLVEVPRKADFSLAVDDIQTAIRQNNPKVVFLTAPNNPDGRLPAEQEVKALLESEALLVIDEAYIEFAGEDGKLGADLSLINEVAKRDNLVVLRTFSKWAGLAGLRVGYGAFPAWLMPALWKAKQPYNVNVAASVAALASLEDREYLGDNVRKIVGERDRLATCLQRVPYLHPQPSRTNFVLCAVTDRSAIGLKRALAERGVLVRHYDTPYLRNTIRISVGKPEDTDRLMEALSEIRRGDL